MTKPNLLVIAPTPYFSDRGCHIRIYEQLKLIAQLGYQAQLVTYPLGRNTGAAAIHRPRGLFWYHKTTAGPALGKLLLDLRMIPVTYRLAKQLKPKLIHAHLAESMLIAYWLKRKFKLPVVLDLQSVFDQELISYGGIWQWLAPLARLYERWAISQATHVLVSNAPAANILRHRYPHKTITLLADGIGDVYTGSAEKIYDLVYSGGLGKHKGTPYLMQLLKQFSTKKILIIASDPTGYWKQRLPHTTWLDHVPYEQLLPTLAQAKLGIEPKPGDTTEGSAKYFNYLAAGVIPVKTADEIKHPIPPAAPLPLWSHQLGKLKTIYESSSA